MLVFGRLFFVMLILLASCHGNAANPEEVPPPVPEGWSLMDPSAARINQNNRQILLNYPETRALFASPWATRDIPDSAIVLRDRTPVYRSAGGGQIVTLLFRGQRVQIRQALLLDAAPPSNLHYAGTWYEIEDELANIGFVPEEDLFFPLVELGDSSGLSGYFGYWDATVLVPSSDHFVEYAAFTQTFRYPAFYFLATGARALVPSAAIPFSELPSAVVPRIDISLFRPSRTSSRSYAAFSLHDPSPYGPFVVASVLGFTRDGEFTLLFQTALREQGTVLLTALPAFESAPSRGEGFRADFSVIFERSSRLAGGAAAVRLIANFGDDLLEGTGTEVWRLGGGDPHRVSVQGSALRAAPGISALLLARLGYGAPFHPEYLYVPRAAVAQEPGYWVFGRSGDLRGWIWSGLLAPGPTVVQ